MEPSELAFSQSTFAGGGEMAALMRVRDWTHTPLGPVASWPQSLRTIVRVMLTSRFAMWMGWGPDLAFFYNDAYRDMTLAAKHPRGARPSVAGGMGRDLAADRPADRQGAADRRSDVG
jgi:hypothetical protein